MRLQPSPAALTYELVSSETLTIDSVRDRHARRYALAVGDLSGIQRFLYTIVSKQAARALRGRSLALQLIADGIAEKYLREIGLPPVSVLYNGAGKLWMLLPRSATERALRLAEEIDLALQEPYAGRLSFALGLAELSGSDFVGKSVAERWESAARDMEARRRRRFSDSCEAATHVFSNRTAIRKQTCLAGCAGRMRENLTSTRTYAVIVEP